jgi:hypothetical protein
MSDHEIVYIVAPTSHIFRIEKLLQGADIPCHPVPNPRHIDHNCGVCLRVNQTDQARAHAILQPIAGLIFTWREG